jgi:hypothetical protein
LPLPQVEADTAVKKSADSIDFIDMPLDFKPSMPVGKLVHVMTSAAPMQLSGFPE